MWGGDVACKQLSLRKRSVKVQRGNRHGLETVPPPEFPMTSEPFECEIGGRKAVCWIHEGDLHAKFEDGELKIYRNVKILNTDFHWPKDIVKQEIIFKAISE